MTLPNHGGLSARTLLALLACALAPIRVAPLPAANPEAAAADDDSVSVFPAATWSRRSPESLDVDAGALEALARLAGGRGCVVRGGHLIYTWGDATLSGDIASASKPLYSHLLFAARAEGRLASLDEKVSGFRPCLAELNPALDHKDRALTIRHLAFQTACLGVTEKPGTAFDYNDATMGLFWDIVVEDIWKTSFGDALERVFVPRLAGPLGFEDPFDFPVEGRKAGRPRVSPRDFARFGLLYLREGRWKDRQLISRDDALRVRKEPLPLSIPRTEGKPAESCATRSIGGGGNQCDHNGGYSWLWWLNSVARDGERWWRDAPPDVFCALGHCGRRGLVVFPSLDLIVSFNDTKELHCDRALGNAFLGGLARAAGWTPAPVSEDDADPGDPRTEEET